MTGPEHYAEAERLVTGLAGWPDDERDEVIACAQVHATLALAAAFGDTEKQVARALERTERRMAKAIDDTVRRATKQAAR